VAEKKKEVNVLIAGITGHICDSCITQAHSIVKEEGGVKSKDEIEKFRIKYLGKKGLVNFYFSEFKNVDNSKKKKNMV